MIKNYIYWLIIIIVGFIIGLTFNGHFLGFETTINNQPITDYSEAQIVNILSKDPTAFQSWTTLLSNHKVIYRVSGSWLTWFSLITWIGIFVFIGKALRSQYVFNITSRFGKYTWHTIKQSKSSVIRFISASIIWCIFILAIEAMGIITLYSGEFAAWVTFPPIITYLVFWWFSKYASSK